MKKTWKKTVTFGIICLLLMANMLTASAAAPVVDEDFEGALTFVSAGDMNADGTLGTSDLVQLTQVLLGAQADTSKYSDMNGDASVNILDLVRMKKTIAAGNTTLIASGVGFNSSKALSLSGNSVYYTGGFVASLETGTTYQISYRVRSDAGIGIQINGVGGSVTLNSGTSNTLNQRTSYFTTGSALTADQGLELKLTGTGVIDNLVVTKADFWADSNTLEQGGRDIFTH